MAGNTPTLTNENYHIFEPSPIETSLASQANALIPSNASPMLSYYQARNSMSGNQYQAQLDQMHQIQQQEAAANQSAARADNFTKFLKVAGETPGAVAAMVSAGLVPQGADLSGVDAGSNAKALASNLGNGGRGLGAMAMGGFTGLAPAAQSVAGPGVGQGPSALEKAAAIKSAGHGGGGGGGGSGIKFSTDADGVTRASGKALPGETIDQFTQRVNGGNPLPTFDTVRKSTRPGQTSLPQAPQTGAPVAAKSSGVASGGDNAGIVQAARKGLVNLQRTNPAGYADVAANKGTAIVPHASGIGAKGASGQVYPLQVQ